MSVSKALREDVVRKLHRGLIVSCQPVPGGPMDRTEYVVAMAMAAVAGGAQGLRIEGVERVRAVVSVCAVPVVGIVKRDLPGIDVRISPTIPDIVGLAEAGATVIAFDATDRVRPVAARELLAAVESAGCLSMADCATMGEASAMAGGGCDFVASTLSGYTGGPVPGEPDLELVRQMAMAGHRVVAEGRYNSPALAAAAIDAGAHAVTVGSAITRIEHIVGWFRSAMTNGAGGLSL